MSQEIGPGTTLLHYRISEQIGSGGMGVVWKAIDTKLDRDVALKLLRADRRGDSAWRERLVREAKCASVLQHPGIVAIHDVQCDDEPWFIVMEYVNGESLRQLLRQQRLDARQALDYGLQICDALAAAHAAGIVHRDLKPGNIMIGAGGRIRILDFGLARTLTAAQPVESDEAPESLTPSGLVVGTPQYMSPEQAVGGRVDASSDVFAFGLVLYEMLAGQPPFRGGSPLGVLWNLMREEPTPLRSVSPGVSEELEAFIRQCLEKDASRRYADCGKAANALRPIAARQASHASLDTISMTPPAAPARIRWTWRMAAVAVAVAAVGAIPIWMVTHPAARQRGIAVLPFTNVDGGERAQAFSVGLAMAVSSQLSAMESLQKAYWVVPEQDVLQAKTQSAGEARKAFGVDLTLGGSVQASGGQVRVTADLSDARSRRQLHSRQITADAADSFQLQDEFVRVATEMLGVEPSAQNDSTADAASSQPGAEDYYLQGRGYLEGGKDKAESAIEVLQEAVRIDPKFARAYAALGEAYMLRYQATMDAGWITKARDSCATAQRLGGDTPEMLMTLGIINGAQGRYEESTSLLQRVVSMQPHNGDAWIKLGWALVQAQRPREAESAFRRAIEIQPSFPVWRQTFASFLYRIGRYPDAERSLDRARELAPDNYRTYLNLGGLYLQTGRYREAETALKHSVELHPSANAYNNLAVSYFYRERYAEAIPMQEKALQLGERSLGLVSNLARLYRFAGKADLARATYKQAFDLADAMLKTNPRDAETHADLAWMLAENGDRAGALRELDLARAFAPDNGAVLFRAVIVYELVGSRPQAIAAYRLLRKTGSYMEEVERRPELKALRATAEFKGAQGAK